MHLLEASGERRAVWSACGVTHKRCHLSITDNDWVQNQIRPITIGRSNWPLAGRLRAGQRAAALLSLPHSARINGGDSYACLKDVLERLPTQPANRIDALPPHHWRPVGLAH